MEILSDEYRVFGGKRLSGETSVQGAKNAALPILAASLLVPGVTVLTGCPDILDVKVMLEILGELGCEVSQYGDTVAVDASQLTKSEVPEYLMREMRSSIMLLGALLGRCGEGAISAPGGCAIGLRPIDMHLAAIESLGAEVIQGKNRVTCRWRKAGAAEVILPYPSVGATENTMFSAVRLPGTTLIRGAAKEPEIIDLQQALCAMGARVQGAGSSVIRIDGVAALHPACYQVMPDRIAAATLLAAGASAGGDIFVKGARGCEMVPALNVLRRMGAEVSDGSDGIRLRRKGHLRSAGIIETAPYPGFPTDMQAPFMAVACSADGVTTVNENVFENRFRHVPELMKLGADITVSERTATVTGVTKLRGGAVEAAELRGGAALIIAGLAAEGKTTVSGRKYIDRGYENIARDLTALGVKIEGAKKEE